jgi:hypothetical protein
MITRGAIGQLRMDAQQELPQPRPPWLPTGVPDGGEEALRSIGSGRQPRQMPQPRGHEDQTPLCPHGFGTPQAVLGEAHVPLTVLLERVCRPALQRQADALGGAPVHPVRHQHDHASCQGLMLQAHHEPQLTQAGEADGQREAPRRVLADGDRALRLRRDQWHQCPDREVRACAGSGAGRCPPAAERWRWPASGWFGAP